MSCKTSQLETKDSTRCRNFVLNYHRYIFCWQPVLVSVLNGTIAPQNKWRREKKSRTRNQFERDKPGIKSVDFVQRSVPTVSRISHRKKSNTLDIIFFSGEGGHLKTGLPERETQKGTTLFQQPLEFVWTLGAQLGLFPTLAPPPPPFLFFRRLQPQLVLNFNVDESDETLSSAGWVLSRLSLTNRLVLFFVLDLQEWVTSFRRSNLKANWTETWWRTVRGRRGIFSRNYSAHHLDPKSFSLQLSSPPTSDHGTGICPGDRVGTALEKGSQPNCSRLMM